MLKHHLLLCCWGLLCFTQAAFSAETETTAMRCIQQDLRIAIDIGHSPSRPGARSARGRYEYAFNKVLAEDLLARLHTAGFTQAYILTSKNPEMPLHARASLANAKKTDLLLSIHHDSVQPHYLKSWEHEGETQHYSDKFSGHSLFVSGKNAQFERSQAFASVLADELLALDFKPTLHHAEAIEGENRPLLNEKQGLYQFDDLLILKHTKAPAVLLECAILVNRDDELRAQNPLFQQAIIAAVERAIMQFATVSCEQ